MGSLCDPGPMGPLAKHNKMLEYLNLCLLCVLFALILYLYSRVKRYLPLLKMAEEFISNLGYDGTAMRPQALWAHETPQVIAVQAQSATKRQKLLKCILTGNSKLIWARFTLKISSPNLAKKKWKNFLTIMKLSYRARWCIC